MIGCSVAEIAATAPIVFAVGSLAGFIASNRWKIIRRDGG